MSRGVLTIIRLLLERTWFLLALLIVTQCVLLSIWSWRRTRIPGIAAWVGLGVGAVLLLINLWVVTPRERIVLLCGELAGMVDEGNVPGIERHLADGFEAEGLNKVQFVARATQILSESRIDDPFLYGFSVTFPRTGFGEVTFEVICRVRHPEAVIDHVRSRWRMKLRSDDDAWRVTGLESLPTQGSPIRALLP